MKCKSGDWVRFMQAGVPVIGRVEYRQKRATWERSHTLITTVGAVSEDSVLERRGATGDEVVYSQSAD